MTQNKNFQNDLDSEKRLLRFCPELTPSESGDISAKSKFLDSLRGADDFTNSALEKAVTLDPTLATNKAVASLDQDEVWRHAWIATPDRFSNATVRTSINIRSPEDLLACLTPVERQELLIKYIKAKCSKSVKDNEDLGDLLDEIIDANAADLDKPEMRKKIQTFLLIRQEMQTGKVSDPELQTSTLSRKDLNENVTEELKQLYLRGNKYSELAFDEYTSALNKFPSAENVSEDPIGLHGVLRGLNFNTMFVSALDPVTYKLITADHLKEMHKRYVEQKQNTNRVVQETHVKLTEKKAKMEELNTVSNAIADGWKNLNGWGKLGVIAVGGFIIYKVWNWKPEGTFGKILKGSSVAVAAVTGFYMLGGGDLIKKTKLGPYLGEAEKFVNKSVIGTQPEITKKDVENYARFLTEVAQEPVYNMEAMGYMTQLPLSAIANSFTFEGEARTGTLNLNEGSELVKTIREKYGKQADEVIRLISSNSLEICDGLAHAFYVLGAMKRPADHAKVEKARMNGTYDAISGPARKTYESLAGLGKNSVSDYKNAPLSEIFGPMMS